MNVLYVCADRGIPVFGAKGASVHLRSVTTAMQRLGHRVTVAARQQGAGNPGPAVHRLVWLQEDPVDTAGRLEALIRAERVDVVIERYSLESAAARVATWRCGVPLTLEVNARLVEEATRYRGLVDPAAEQREQRTLRDADRIHTVSSALLSWVRESAPAVPATWIPNGADVAHFRASHPPAADPFPGRPVVGFAGSMKPWHGVDQLLEAFARARETHPEAALILVGTGPLADAVRERSRRPDLRGHVLCTGQVPQDDVPAWVARFDIAVAPYLPLEGFYFHPLKVVEYLAGGRAVVYSDQGDMRELVGGAGLAHAPGSVPQLAERLTRLLGDEALRGELAAAAASGGAALDWGVIAERVLTFAGEARPQPPARPPSTSGSRVMSR